MKHGSWSTTAPTENVTLTCTETLPTDKIRLGSWGKVSVRVMGQGLGYVQAQAQGYDQCYGLGEGFCQCQGFSPATGIRKSSCSSYYSSSSSGRAALLLTLALNFGVYKYDPSLLDSSGKELPFMFSTLLIIVIAAICIQWQFACFGTIYNGELISFVTINTARGRIEHLNKL